MTNKLRDKNGRFRERILPIPASGMTITLGAESGRWARTTLQFVRDYRSTMDMQAFRISRDWLVRMLKNNAGSEWVWWEVRDGCGRLVNHGTRLCNVKAGELE